MNENKANYAKIGFFVLSGLALLLLVIGIAGARVFNKKVVMAETYFTESVTGLDTGSPVKYRGVPIGEVKRIGFVYNEYQEQAVGDLPHTNANQVLVIMALDPERFGLLKVQNPTAVLNRLVDQGLRVRLSMSGVTGLAFLELDYARSEADPERLLKPAWAPHHPYIPPATSIMTTLKKAVDDVFVKLSGVDFQGLGDELLTTMSLLQDKLAAIDTASLSQEATTLLTEVRATNRSIKQLLDSPELAQLPAGLSATVASARRSAEGIEAQIGPLAKSLQALAGRANELVDSANGLVSNNSARVDNAVSALNQTAQTLNRTAISQQDSLADLLQNLRSASLGLDRVVNELSANPSALLFGQPPEPLPETRTP